MVRIQLLFGQDAFVWSVHRSMTMSVAFGPFRLDAVSACLWRGEQLLPLPPKPFAVLAHLVAHAGEVVSKETLLEAVWSETIVSEGVLKTCMGQIRQVLGETARQPRYIATVHRRGYRFIAPVMPVMPASMAAVSSDAPLCPLALSSPARFVARDTELTELHQRWQQVLQGTRQVVFITGEAGIGKTALVDAFVDHLQPPGGVWIGRGQCIGHYGAGEAYLPLFEALGQLGQGPYGARLVDVLHQQAPSWLLHMPGLLPVTAHEALQQRSSGMTGERMLRELADALEVLTTERPLVLILEDLHWSDHATLDWLTFVAHRRGVARLLILATYRPADAVVRHHSVHRVAQELQRHGQAYELPLGYLSEGDVIAYLTQRFGPTPWPGTFICLLYQRTNGNPFFLVTVVDELVRQGILESTASGWTLRSAVDAVDIEVPESIRQLIELQLTPLNQQEQEILAAASVVGNEFSAEAVAAAVGIGTEDLEAQCDALCHRRQFVRPQEITLWPDRTVTTCYRFIHDLYREIVYARIPMSRRVRWHRQIGLRLEAGYGDQARQIAAELAIHFSRGHDPSRAAQYRYQAADNALRRSAYAAAVEHLVQGLDVLRTLPDTPERAHQELPLQIALGQALWLTRGRAAREIERAFARARLLCQQIGETSQFFSVLRGLYAFSIQQAELYRARELAGQLHVLAQDAQDDALLVEAHRASGAALFYLGEFAQARQQVKHCLRLYKPQQHGSHTVRYGFDPRIVGLAYMSWSLWFLGYPVQAQARLQELLTRAQALSHPYSLAVALLAEATLHQFGREPACIEADIQKVIVLSADYGFPHVLAMGMILQGWAMAMQGRGAEGVTQLQEGLTAERVTGEFIRRPYYLFLLAEAYGTVERVEAGLHELAEAFPLVTVTAERWWEAGLYRLQGELLLRRAIPDEKQSEVAFHQALSVAHRQAAKSLELRAATSLARLWQSRNKCQVAYDLLAPIYDGFTEGFETADLQEARTLLDELA
jgi:predicted ATPase/DNA-binding winged helix-turn-helix (wHTH) protein